MSASSVSRSNSAKIAAPSRGRLMACFFLSAFLPAGMALASDSDSPDALIARMLSATKSLSYDGVFIYQRDDQIDTMRIIHKNVAGVEVDRLVSLSGPKREVIRDGSKVTCVFADNNRVLVEKRQPRDFIGLGLSEPAAGLANYYAFSVSGQERIAERDARVLAITPTSEDRYGYKLWLDVESGLPLKSVILANGGRVLEQVQFVQISIGVEIPNELLERELHGNGSRRHPINENVADADWQAGRDSGWQANWLPRGFEMRKHKTQQLSSNRAPVSHMVYSDGLAMVSVFVEKVMGPDPLRGFSSLGAVNAVSRVAGDHQITVIGEVPLATIRQIAESISHTGQ